MATQPVPPHPTPDEPQPSAARLRTAVEAIAVVILALGLFGLCCLFLAVIYAGHMEGRWTPIFERQFLAIIGIPTSVLGSVAIVQFFRGFHGPIEFTIGPAKFTGATGPVVLWLFCFCAFILGMRHLWQS